MKKKPRSKKQIRIRRAVFITLGVFGALILSVGGQFAYNSIFLSSVGDTPLTLGGDSKLNVLLRDGLTEPDSFFDDSSAISESLRGGIEEINDRNDCSDFTAMAMIRFYYENQNRLSETNKNEIRDALTGYTYWPSEDGGKPNGMCFWSENHQIMFASDEYLAGLAWPSEIFADGMTGQEHLAFAKERIAYWMENRFYYGFSEYYSNNYYPEDIGPMSNFIQFASKEDKAMANQMKIILDLVFYDIASQSFRYQNDGKTYYAFMSASGRMYFDNKASDDTGNRLRDYVSYLLNINSEDYADSTNKFFNSFRHLYEAKDDLNVSYYQLPKAIKNIFDDPSDEQIVKSSSGLNVSELSHEKLIGQDTRQIMFQFGMEAFSNPEVIDNSIAFMNKYHLFRNEMLNDFKTVNLWPLTLTRTLGALSNALHPATDGKAIERGNIYTYQTPDYSFSTNQDYHPGQYGDQQQTSLITLGHDLSVFTSLPERKSDREAYWLGQGRMPDSVQDKNIGISLFRVPTSPGFMEPYAVSFSHTYFPLGLFDETETNHLGEGYVFGRKGNAYIMIRAISDDASASLSFKNDQAGVTEQGIANDIGKIKTSVADLIQASNNPRYDLIYSGGTKHCYVTECSNKSKDGSFVSFVQRALRNPLSFDPDAMSVGYQSGGIDYEKTYQGVFSVNQLNPVFDYPRYESPYVLGGSLSRKSETIAFSFMGSSLSLNYREGTRDE